ncbi:hypothetical protein HN784_00135 [bacterium]|nr:hypothetical protein [bacterium]MBT4251012.1 hypothetical protein [bacterium]MBT4597756.1 hypothetical protein [bacterium]MBT6753851.1 hypothetical protein [bacterium]MBT7037437.1 hypothetical protein [bacterium]
MKRKTKFFAIGLILLLGVLLLFYFFINSDNSKKSFRKGMEDIDSKDWEQTEEFSKEEDEGITFELSLIDHCDSGEWIEVATNNNDLEFQEYTGFVMGSERGEELSYSFEDGKWLIFSKPEFGEFFEDRELVVHAYEEDKKLVVLRAKCLNSNLGDEESNEPVTEGLKVFEQQTMLKLSKEANSLIKKRGSWEVVSFLWPNKNYVYVEFSAIEKEEDFEKGESLSDDEVESYLLLLRITKEGQNIFTEEIGLLKMDDEDEWIAERGKDLFDDVDDGRLFDFNTDLGKWTKIN